VIRAGFALLLLSLPVEAQVALLEAGVVCPRETTGELLPAPGTEAGAIRMIEQATAFDTDARRVPMLDLLSFGFRVASTADAPQEATIVVTHPPMGPRAVTRQEWVDTLWPGEGSLNLFTFEEAYEKVPGPWTFAVEVAGEAVVEVSFDVVPAGASGPVEQVCFQFMS
jgi:hypothetical protein